jgi:S-adenosylmethionine-diacylglycerol 3-amino-3-carboxypropyl transferase
MSDSEISNKANFGDIRYAQLWEDADVLVAGLASPPGATLVSICSAGDNALAMLTLDPAKVVVVVDLSDAQLACLEFRVAAYRTLDHSEFLRLLGARLGDDRGALFDRVIARLPMEAQAFWQARRDEVVAHGLGGVGKFERYFRLFSTKLLPLVHSRATIEATFERRDRPGREAFLQTRWNNWRWRLLVACFFSRFAMGRLGRDAAFFDHVEGSPAAHVSRRIAHAAVTLQPADNPYLAWILTGKCRDALPLAWRAEHYATIRDRLNRLDIRKGSLERFVATGEKADGFNLSDIFEYMSPDVFADVYGRLLSAANQGARLVYWNMMAPRRAPGELARRVIRRQAEEEALKTEDKAFFYSDFVIEEVT